MQVSGIDHVHIEVRDREVAAAWYARVMGFERHKDLSVWAEDAMGPLILATGDGQPVLSLFARECEPPSRDTTIAFGVSGPSFVEFVGSLGRLGLSHVSGSKLTDSHVVDHELSWSIYFCDPDGNRLELTTYDYHVVASELS